jgi:hypothetical protein
MGSRSFNDNIIRCSENVYSTVRKHNEIKKKGSSLEPPNTEVPTKNLIHLFATVRYPSTQDGCNRRMIWRLLPEASHP